MAIVFTFLATVPAWISDVGLYEYIALEIAIWCIYAMGYNLALGYTGLPSFGHGAFFGVGAYAMAIYQVHWAGDSLWIGLALSIMAGIIAGGITGAMISHRRGIYFSLLTIAFGQMFWFLAIKLRDVTKGEDGLLNLQRLPAEFGLFSIDLSDTISLYYFTFFIFVIVVIALWVLIHSSFGYIIRALKQNETRAQFLGYNVTLFKLIGFTLSTAISALAGGLFALAQGAAFPDVMSLHWSGIIVMMTIIGGGMVSFWGPILGVMFYFVTRDVIGGMDEFLGGFVAEAWLMWFGAAFMLIIVFQPEGIAGIWGRIERRFQSRPSTETLASTEAAPLGETAQTTEPSSG